MCVGVCVEHNTTTLGRCHAYGVNMYEVPQLGIMYSSLYCQDKLLQKWSCIVVIRMSIGASSPSSRHNSTLYTHNVATSDPRDKFDCAPFIPLFLQVFAY